MYRILSLDGGGMKGIFTTTLLERIVDAHPTFLDSVDLIAGTSTGGIVALGLAKGLEPSQLTDLYRKEGRKIFDDSFWDNLKDFGNAAGADYDHKGMKRVLKKHLGASTQLSDLGKHVLIPAFDLDAEAKPGRPRTWKPKFFHNFPGRDSDGKEKAVDVAIRTSSAPTYFPSYQGYIDGGVVANNPSMSAIAQALSSSGGKQKSIESISVLSLGTGEEPKYIRGNKDWGWGQWARPLVSLMIGGVMGVADYQCKQLLDSRYRRVDAVLDDGVNLDDTSDETLDRLQAAARGVSLRGVKRWLSRNEW